MPKPKGSGSRPPYSATGGSPTTSSESEPHTPPRSLFRPEDNNAIRGELVVKLKPSSEAAIAASIPVAPLRGLTESVPNEFGIPELDTVLARFKSRGIVRVHPPRSSFVAATAEATALSGTYRIRLAESANLSAAVKALAEVSAVEAAEPNRWRETTAVPNDPSFAAQWGLARINCPQAWDYSVGAAAVIVAVVDSGVDLNHPELATHLLPGQDLVDLTGASPPPGTHFEGDWTGRDDQPQDEVGHGTHVAGTIACATNNAIGVTGVTWDSSLLPVKVLTRVVENAPPHRVRGVGSAVDIAAGIRWAVDHSARVINLSLGGYGDTFVERDAVAYAVSQGVVVVAAMGNDDTTDPSYPAAYPGVIAVGATNQADQRAPFSNRGPHIDVVAPGVDILSTVWDDGYASFSGTSMASPHVAGIAALLLACNPALTAEEIGTLIRSTARPLRNDPADPVPNDHYGAGLVDAAASVMQACTAFPPPVTIPPTRPTMFPTQPPLTRPTLTLPPTRPTLTLPTRPTLPTFPTAPTAPTFPTRPTLTLPTRPTLPTFPTRPTAPTFPTAPTAPTFPTRPTLTLPTRPTLPTFPTRPTAPTFPTAPTAPTFPTRPTLTLPTRPTRPTFTFPTRPTAPTFPTRPTFTFPTRPTRPTLPTVGTLPTRPTVGTFVPPVFEPGGGFGGGAGYDPYGGGGYEYSDPYGGAGYESYYDPYGGAGYETYYDPYASYYDPYAGYYDPYAGTGYESYQDPYSGGYEGYDPYGGYGGGYGGYADPSGGYGYAEGYDPYSGYY